MIFYTLENLNTKLKLKRFQLKNERNAKLDLKTTGHVQYYARTLALSSKGKQTETG